MSMRASLCGVAALCVAFAGCSHNEAEYPDECRDGPGDDVKMAGRTAGQGVEAGAETGVAGVKQTGRAVGGWLEGGSDEANRQWEKGKIETKQEAAEGKQEIKAEKRPNCP